MCMHSVYYMIIYGICFYSEYNMSISQTRYYNNNVKTVIAPRNVTPQNWWVLLITYNRYVSYVCIIYNECGVCADEILKYVMKIIHIIILYIQYIVFSFYKFW